LRTNPTVSDLDEHAGVGEAVQQRRLAGVRVADDGDGAVAGAGSPLALRAARGGHRLQLGLELAHAPQQPPAVDLELRLTGAAGANPCALL
jgi:hypothetical protein